MIYPRMAETWFGAGRSRRHVVDSGFLPSALRPNASGVIQNRSRRFCRDIGTSMYKKPFPQKLFRSVLQRQRNLRFLVIATINECNITDSCHQLCGSLFAEVGNDAVARLPIAGAYANFDQFVVRYGGAKFLQQGFCQAGVTDQNDGFQLMAEPSQKLFLRFE